MGFPVSTTHGLLGAMIGAGYAAAGGGGINLDALGKSFVVPLLLGPALATLLGAILYLGLRRVRRSWSPLAADCLCVDLEPSTAPSPIAGLAAASVGATTTVLRIETCSPAQRRRDPDAGGLRVTAARAHGGTGAR
jgi:PiT family inorganic phosphate transporter